MPTDQHQASLRRLFLALNRWCEPRGGLVLFAVLRLYLAPLRYREPDILLLLDAEDPRRQDRFWRGADLVAEIVSPSSRRHDLEVKRKDYAEAGIPEYWIVDPERGQVIVLVLEQDRYRELGRFGRGSSARSRLLDGFEIPVSSILGAR